MNRIARWMLRLYPVQWRRRYGDELDALLTDTGADVQILVDLLGGAVRMQFSTWSLPRLAAVLGLAGLLIGAAVSLLTPPQYVARTEIVLSGADSPVLTMSALATHATSRSSLAPIIHDPDLRLYSELLKTAPLQDVIEQMRRDIRITTPGGSAIAIQFTYPEPEKAVLVVKKLAAQLPVALRQLAPEKYVATEGRHLDIVDTPSLATHPMPLNLWGAGASGLAAGLLLAVLLRLARRTTIRLSMAGTLGGVAVAWIVGSWLPPTYLPDGEFPFLRYQSTAKLYARSDAETMAHLLTKLTSRTSLAEIINAPQVRLYPEQLKTKTLEDAIDTMQRVFSVTSHSDRSGGHWIDLSFIYPDRFRAQQAVQVAMMHLDEDFNAVRRSNAKPADMNSVHWGSLEGSEIPAITVEAARQYNNSPALTGFLTGLALAIVIALFRRRWTTDAAGGFRFDGLRFARLAIILTFASVSVAGIVAWRTPASYKSEAVVAFEQANPGQAAGIIRDSIVHNPASTTSDLTWEQMEAGGAKTDVFRFQFVSGNPRAAWAGLQQVLGAIDQSLAPYHAVRGVDNLDTFAIPFDDERARPAVAARYRAIRMNVIDWPSVPTHTEGLGRWKVGIAGAAGLALAALLSLLSSFRDWFGTKRTDAIASV